MGYWQRARRRNPPIQKESPGACGASSANKGGSLEGPKSLDAPILSPGTNHARRGSRKRPDPPMRVDGPEACATTHSPLPERHGRDDPKQKLRALVKCGLLIGGVPIAVAPICLARMLQRTFPAGFIPPCLPTKTDKLAGPAPW
jgi:hypothetical protein